MHRQRGRDRYLPPDRELIFDLTIFRRKESRNVDNRNLALGLSLESYIPHSSKPDRKRDNEDEWRDKYRCRASSSEEGAGESSVEPAGEEVSLEAAIPSSNPLIC